jgi:hypothetical protein
MGAGKTGERILRYLAEERRVQAPSRPRGQSERAARLIV